MSFFIIIYDFMALKSHEYAFKHSLCSLSDQLSDLPPGTVLFPCVAVVYGGTVIKIEYINAVVSGTGTSPTLFLQPFSFLLFYSEIGIVPAYC